MIRDEDRAKPMVHHQLNCAKLMPRSGNGASNPCSCGAEETRGPVVIEKRSIDDASMAEWDAASKAYREKLASPRLGPVPVMPTESGPVGSPVNSEPSDRALARWWVEKSQEDVSAISGKAREYGGEHRASDLTDLGRDLADLMGLTKEAQRTDAALQELAIYFYIDGKLGRWKAALLEGRRVSDDTLHDIKIYATMAQRIREVGGWPV